MTIGLAISSLVTVLALAVPSAAETEDQRPDAATAARRMSAALEPTGSCVRSIDLVVSTDAGDTRQWRLAQARTPDAVLSIVLSPEALRGTAHLVRGRDDGELPAEWYYVPMVRRVRKVFPAMRGQAFLGSDFTLADLGAVERRVSYEPLEVETVAGRELYKLEARPRDSGLYERIVTWVDPATWIPTRREFYDVANRLWRVETFGRVTAVDGASVPHLVRMEDVQTDGWSELRVREVRCDADVPKSLFDPEQLARAAEQPLWRAAGE